MPPVLAPPSDTTAPRAATPPPSPGAAHGAPEAALALYAQVLAAANHADAARVLATALAARAGADQATIGWCGPEGTRLLCAAVGSVEGVDPARRARLVGAMDEALEQGVALRAARGLPATSAGPGATGDAGAEGDDVLAFEQRLLLPATGGAVATLPLGADGVAWGAVCLERAQPAFDAAELARLQHLLALAGPALHWRAQAERPLRRQAADELATAWRALRHPDRRLRRRGLLAVAAAIVLAAVVPLPREVAGRARVEGAEQRVLVAPADGFVQRARVRPGDAVKAGDVLVELLDADLKLERERWTSQRAQHENAYAAAMAKSDRAAAATSLARIAEADAQVALVDEQLARGRLVAPFDGVVIQGDLAQSGGAPVKQGDTLMTLATTGRQRVIVDVDETDIAAVLPGQHGTLALSALPWTSRDIVVERVTPLAKAVEGRNVFEVQARVVDTHPGMPGGDPVRPGLLGRAHLVVGQAPPLWAWAGQLAARLRVAWWAWLG